jgi:hypothetical protein
MLRRKGRISGSFRVKEKLDAIYVTFPPGESCQALLEKNLYREIIRINCSRM